MNLIRRWFSNVFFWTYDRGSWQWDLSCLVFLVIIFATPSDFLNDATLHPLSPDQIRSLWIDYLRSIL